MAAMAASAMADRILTIDLMRDGLTTAVHGDIGPQIQEE
jgi:hypothetical protein